MHHVFGKDQLRVRTLREREKDMSQEILKNFDFEGKQVRTVVIDNEPWFVLSDVCKVLGMTNVTEVKKRLDQHDFNSIEVIDSIGRKQKTVAVNESGLYDVILDSRKPQAKQFRRWITSEVIPSIRKHGGYLTEEKIEEALFNPDVIIKLATDLKEERLKRSELEAQKALDAPKVALAEAVGATQGNVTLTTMSKILRNAGSTMNRNEFCQWLRDEGYLFKAKAGNTVNLPIKMWEDAGLFEVQYQWIPAAGRSVETTHVTAAGQEYFINLFLEEEMVVN